MAVLEPVRVVRESAAAALGKSVAIVEALDEFLAHQLDVVCIASPTALHTTHIRAAANAGVRFLLVEKPVTPDLLDFHALMAFWSTLPRPPRTFVNYFRRTLPQTHAMLDACRAKRLLGLDFVYSRGLAVNGIHLVDLCGYLLDLDCTPEIVWVEAADQNNPHFALKTQGITVTFRGYNLDYHCIEARATFPDGRLSLLEGGSRLEWEPCLPNVDHPGFFRLGACSPALDPVLTERAFRDGTYSSLCALLDESAPSPSPLEGSYFAQGVLDAVMRQAKR